MPEQNYDIIGDIHGHADELALLLNKLGYSWIDGCYRHSERRVIFLGDFIDRGPKQREVLQTVIPMVQQGSALAVMGNHEFNALAFHTQHPELAGNWLRPRNNKNIQQHLRFLDEYVSNQEELANVLEFFFSLPLWLDLGGLRVVHACWEPRHVEYLGNEGLLTPDNLMTQELLVKANNKGSPEYDAIEALLKGVEYELPPGEFFRDKDGHNRTAVRTRWWTNEDCFLRDVALPPGVLDDTTGKLEILGSELVGYPPSEKPVFIGHYWLKGIPERLAENVACIDYSVAKGGKLVAYRWEGENQLYDENFIYVS
jgi:hypothetical protein